MREKEGAVHSGARLLLTAAIKHWTTGAEKHTPECPEQQLTCPQRALFHTPSIYSIPCQNEENTDLNPLRHKCFPEVLHRVPISGPCSMKR